MVPARRRCCACSPASASRPAGAIKRAHNLRIGYFSQDKNDLPQHGTVLEALRELDRTVDERTLRDHLALFLFCGDDVEKPVGELSGGEKQRLSLARMTRAQFDLLCLDEPTNHLDVAGTEGLEQALKEFPGTVVLITHDRKLVDEVADRVLWVEDGAVRTFDQGLAQCQKVLADERAAARAAEAEARDKARKKAEAEAPPRGEEGDRDRQGAQPADVPAARGAHHQARGGSKDAARGDARPGELRQRRKMKELQGTEVRLKAEIAEAYEQWENWQ
jgi:ATP-binding cassette subfamily F protein 3